MRSRISPAAARVKVTMSMRSMRPPSLSRDSTRSTSTAVLPEPAAALTSTLPLRASMAARCPSVQRIQIPPTLFLPLLYRNPPFLASKGNTNIMDKNTIFDRFFVASWRNFCYNEAQSPGGLRRGHERVSIRRLTDFIIILIRQRM